MYVDGIPIPPVPHNVNAHPFICLSSFDAGKKRTGLERHLIWTHSKKKKKKKKNVAGPCPPLSPLHYVYFFNLHYGSDGHHISPHS